MGRRPQSPPPLHHLHQAPHHTLGLVTVTAATCVRVTVLVAVVGLALVVVGVGVVAREQQPHRVVSRHGVQQLRVLAVDEVPPAAGLPALVVDRAVGAQPAELEAVDAGPHGAGVVHLAEGRHVRVVAVPKLVRAAAHRAALDTADCPRTHLKEVSGTVARMGKSSPGTPGTEMPSILMLTMSSVIWALT